MKYGIDPEVWQAIIGDDWPTLPKIMYAASIYPAMLDEDTREPRNMKEAVSLAMEAHGFGRDPVRSATIVVLNALAQWIMDQKDAREAVQQIAGWDRRVAVWCSAACVESVIRSLKSDGATMEFEQDLLRKGMEWAAGEIAAEDIDTSLLRLGRDVAGSREELGAYVLSALLSAATDVAYMAHYSLYENPHYAADAITGAAAAYSHYVVFGLRAVGNLYVDRQDPNDRLHREAMREHEVFLRHLVKFRDDMAASLYSFPIGL